MKKLLFTSLAILLTGCAFIDKMGNEADAKQVEALFNAENACYATREEGCEESLRNLMFNVSLIKTTEIGKRNEWEIGLGQKDQNRVATKKETFDYFLKHYPKYKKRSSENFEINDFLTKAYQEDNDDYHNAIKELEKVK